MTKVIDALAGAADRPVFICDFTPPRGGTLSLLDGARHLGGAEFVSVAYNPGKLVRAESASAAFRVKEITGRDAVFNLSPRDMNRVALETRLLGAQMLGLENVVILQGDRFTARDGLSAVGDYTATDLIAAAHNLKQGRDYRDANLRAPCDLCIGATIDLNRDAASEAALTHRKVEAGAEFFLTQPIFDPAEADALLAQYEALTGAPLQAPVFWGLQILAAEGVLFSNVPEVLRQQVEAGRDGVEIALETFERFRAAGIRSVYLVSPIMRGGARDYEAAGRFLAQAG